MSTPPPERAGMRAMFWTWMGIIAIGLAVMIAVPLTGL
jgi:hypothetical protein